MTRRVVVVGGGNAALCAALSARERGAQVTLLERAPFELRGGNTRFTAGAMRAVYDGVDDLVRLMPDLTASEIERTDFSSYLRREFLRRPGTRHAIPLRPGARRTARRRQLRDAALDAVAWRAFPAAVRAPIVQRRRSRAFLGRPDDRSMGRWSRPDRFAHRGRRTIRRRTALRRSRDRTNDASRPRLPGVRIQRGGREEAIDADAVVLAAGGFEANPAWRARYLGPGWDLARVRGTRFNTGDGIRMALDVGAAARGHWSGCHAVGWDANAPEFGDLAVGDGFQKHSYPFGIMVNARGQRFVDEGADFRNYTYAKYGREILLQPGQIAWQIFDAKVTSLLRDEYRIRQVSRVDRRYDRCAVAQDRRYRRDRIVRHRSRIQCRRRPDDAVRPHAQGWPCHAWTRGYPNRTGPIRWTRRHSKRTR